MFAPALDDAIQCQVCGNDAVDPAGVTGGSELYRCRWCEFVFAANVLDAGSSRRAPASRGFASQRPEQIAPALSYLAEHQLRVLCIGEAPGALAEYLEQRGHRVSSLIVGQREVDALEAMDLPDDVFDLVCIGGVVQQLTSPVPVIDELLRLTRPGGLVVVHADMQPPAGYADDDRLCAYGSDGRAFYSHRTFEVLIEDTPHRIVVRDARLVGILKQAPHRRLATEPGQHLALV